MRLLGAVALAVTVILAACAPAATCAGRARVLPAPQLAVSGGVAYAVAQHLDAWNAATGTLLWQTNLRLAPTVALSVPVVAGGVVYVATSDSTVLAWRAASGALLWQSRPIATRYPAAGGAVPPPPVVAGGMVYAGLGSGAVAAWRSRDGTPLWQSLAIDTSSISASGATAMTVAIAVPVVAAGAIYYAAANEVMALRPRDGRRIWQARAPLGSIRLSTPVIVSGRTVAGAPHSTLYAGASDDSVYAFDAQTGTLVWHSRPVALPSTANDNGNGNDDDISAPAVVAAGSRIFLGTADGWIEALRLADGAPLWRTQVPGTPPYQAPHLVGTLLYTSSANGVYALNVANGQIAWQAGANLGGQDATLLGTADTTFASGQGHLYAWRARDGGFLWQAPLASTAPLLGTADGLVYMGVAGTTATCHQAGSGNAVVVRWSGDGSVLWQATV